MLLVCPAASAQPPADTTGVTGEIKADAPAATPPGPSPWRAADLPGRSGSSVMTPTVLAASDHPLATEAAIATLRGGGNAADAAVAALAALSVVRPDAVSPGGDVAVIYWDAKTGQPAGLNAVGRLPASYSPQAAPAAGTATVDRDVPHPPGDRAASDAEGSGRWTVPGAVDGWWELHARFGKRPWDELLQPAVRLAREGAPVSAAAAAAWKSADEATRSALGATGEAPPAVGTRVRNEALAATLEAIADGGRAVFYEGDLARNLVAASGGRLTPEDLSAQHGRWVDPISTEYRGRRVWRLPPGSRGVATLQTLNLLSAYDVAKMGRGTPAFLHLLLEARRLSAADARLKVCESTRMTGDVGLMLTPEYSGELRRKIDPNNAAALATSQPPESACGVVIVDADGNVCCGVCGLGRPFGASPAAGMGFQMQDGLSRFAGDGCDLPAAGAAPSHDLGVTIVSQDGSPVFALAATGAGGSESVTDQVLLSLIDFGSDLQDAVDRPRVRPAAPSGDNATPGRGVVLIGPGVDAATAEELRKRGHEVQPVEGAALGSVVVIELLPDGVRAAAVDPRSDAAAGGF